MSTEHHIDTRASDAAIPGPEGLGFGASPVGHFCEACYAHTLGVNLDAECECLEREKIEQIHSGEYREEDWDE